MAVKGQKEQRAGALERASRDVERLVELNLPRIEFLAGDQSDKIATVDR